MYARSRVKLLFVETSREQRTEKRAMALFTGERGTKAAHTRRQRRFPGIGRFAGKEEEM